MELPIVDNVKQCQTRGCGCCGSVQIAIGHSIFRFSEAAFGDWVDELMAFRASLSESREIRAAESLLRTLADRKFSA